MDNRRQIQNLKDYAELAWASYGYFECIGNRFDKEKDKFVSIANVLDIQYKDLKIIDEKGFKIATLKGDFTPTQAKNFFEHYELLEYCPNTDSGFSATLFKDTKADSKDSKYILAIRGTEFKLEQIQDLLNDYYIGTNNSDMNRVIEQYFDMLLFYEETLKPLLQEKGIARINVIGHSLGGYLAQRALIYCDSLYKDKLKFSPSEVYTFNAPLESMSVA